MHNRFIESLEGILKCTVGQATTVAISELGEADCRRALALACKMLCETSRVSHMHSAASCAFSEWMDCERKHLRRWDAEACKYAAEVEQLRSKAEAMDKLVKQVTTRVNNLDKTPAPLSTPVKKAKHGTFTRSIDIRAGEN